MGHDEMQAAGGRILGEARALRAAFPDADAMRRLRVSDLPPAGGEDAGARALRTALGYLRDEMLLVRAGKADSLTVLDDEMANAGSLMPVPVTA